MQDDEKHFDWDEKPKRDLTPLGDSVVSLGKMVVYYCIGLE